VAACVVLALAAAGASSCRRQQVKVDPIRSALETISRERCARSARCQRPGDVFTSTPACITSLEQERAELGIGDCRAGLSLGSLARCTLEIRAADCSLPLERLDALADCTGEALCRGPLH
jgi:hypothetical protein